MLPAALDKIDETLLQRVCDEAWSESHHLDFKAMPHAATADGRTELRKDVCALANADGGDLVIGISESHGKASAIKPVETSNIDQEIRRLVGCLDTEIEPRIQGVRAKGVPISTGGYVVVLRIPRSFSGPHRIGQATAHRFVVRNNTQTSDMTYDQVRSAFLNSSTLIEKASSFVTQRTAEVAAGQTRMGMPPGSVFGCMHLVPFQGLSGRVSVDIAATKLQHTVMQLPEAMNWMRRPNLHGILLCPYDGTEYVDRYIQVHRNGVVEFVWSVHWDSPKGMRLLVAEGFSKGLRDCLGTYAAAASSWEVGGPVLLAASIHCAAQTHLFYREKSLAPQVSDLARMDLGQTLIDDISLSVDLDATTRPLLDVLFQAYGAPQCVFFDSDGKWRG